MPRVVGIDPGTGDIGVCGLDDQHVFVDVSWPTAETLRNPSSLIGLLEEAHHSAALDLIVGPSGYGLPLIELQSAGDADLRLAFLNVSGEGGGIGGLRSLLRALKESALPVVLTPGVIHLESVPSHRKVNRVDMGTADKVCCVALAIFEQARRRRCLPEEASFILLELGGAFSAALAVDRGRIVDGLGGTCGPLGIRSSGALDGEVAFLAGSVSKELLFTGGVASIVGAPAASPEALLRSRKAPGGIDWLAAYVESAVKASVSLMVSVRDPWEIVVSGRMARFDAVLEELSEWLRRITGCDRVHRLSGLAAASSHAAQGAALIADGLAGGHAAPIADTLGIRRASGTVLDNLYVVPPIAAKKRLGLL